MKLKDLKLGQRAVLLSYNETDSDYSRKLKELGLSPGCIVELTSIAPGGDPVLLKVRSFRISLRKEEASILNFELPMNC